MPSDKTAEKLISALGTAALCAVFGIWCANNAYSGLGYAAAAVSVLLMLVLCLLFVPGWCNFWRGSETAAPRAGLKTSESRIFVAFLLWDAVIIILGYILRRAMGYTDGNYFEFWLCTDSQHYMDIARDWYLSSGSMDRLVQLVFLPGYPIVVRIFSYLTGSVLAAGFIVSGLSFALSGVMLYKLARLDLCEAAAMRAVRFFATCPAVFFFAAPMSESLFMLCSLSCLYLIRRGKTLPAVCVGAYAAFTRSLGMILIVPALFELIRRRARAIEYIELLMIPLGFAAYCAVNYVVSGDAFKFMVYQNEHWNQRLGWFFATAAYQTENAAANIGVNSAFLFGLWLPNIIAQLAAMLIMIFAVRRLRPSYTAYFIAYFVVAIGATWLLSAPRYLSAMPSLYIALALLSDNKGRERALYAVSALLLLAYFIMFLLRWQVW